MQRPKGTKDIFGTNQEIKTYIEKNLSQIANIYNFVKIDTPIFEHKNVFTSTIGLDSEIVIKQMYHFLDNKKRPMVLRPEATASVSRAILENKLYLDQKYNRLYYLGPMFRYENPQKGRYRQFHQFGIEYRCPKDPIYDLEVFLMTEAIVKKFKVKTKLLINSLGDKTTRQNYLKVLKAYLLKNKDKLETHSLNRLKNNPLRILDDKIERQKTFIQKAPKIEDYYSPTIKNNFLKLCSYLDNFKIKYQIDPYLVRGLDYYNDTIFEYIIDQQNLGTQNTLIGGGRYDNLLVEDQKLNFSSIGFSLGIERLGDYLEQKKDFKLEIEKVIKVINLDQSSELYSLEIVDHLRENGYPTTWSPQKQKLKKTLAKIDPQLTSAIIFVGQKEAESKTITLKTNYKQHQIKFEQLINFLKKNC